MTDMNRIEARMNACSKKQEKAFITYVTAGLPDLAATKEIIRAQERGGCDVIELGVPFSDPVADGPGHPGRIVPCNLRRGECEEDFCNDAGTAHGGCDGPDHLHDVLQHDPALRRGSVCKKMQ